MKQFIPRLSAREQTGKDLEKQHQPEHGVRQIQRRAGGQERRDDNEQQNAAIKGEQHVARGARPWDIIFVKAANPNPQPTHGACQLAKRARSNLLAGSRSMRSASADHWTGVGCLSRRAGTLPMITLNDPDT